MEIVKMVIITLLATLAAASYVGHWAAILNTYDENARSSWFFVHGVCLSCAFMYWFLFG